MDSSVLARLSAALTGRYTLERELGRGGMATVWLARDLKHDRPVALKVLRPEIAAALGPERFLREITLTAGLDHPHILPLLDSDEAAGFLYYAMPYVAGESLRQRLTREQSLPLDDALQITREVADALGYAHGRGIVHRDIKPENILLAGGHARVADFGIATALTAAAGDRLTATGIAVGTPAYMSPEQGAGSRELDGRSDLYSLGCVLYEMLGGETPYTGPTPQAILAKKLSAPLPRISVVRDAVPAAVEAALSRALARTPADRFHTAAEFVTALTTGPDALHSQAPARTWLQPALLVGVVVALLAAAGGTYVWSGRSAFRSVSITRTVPVTSDPGVEIDPALSPDGTLLAYAAGPMLKTRIYVRPVNGGRPVAIGDSGWLGQRWPKWSPDGGRILYCEGSRALVAPALGGPARVVADVGGEVPGSDWFACGTRGADWSPDGLAIALVALDSLYIVTLADGARRTLGRFSRAHSPAWSPNGKFVALVIGNWMFVDRALYGNSAVSRIVIVPASGGERVWVTGDSALAASPTWLPDGRGLLFVSDRGGSRDVYLLRLSDAGRARGPPEAVTAGLNLHSISLSRDGRRLAYNVYVASANIWTLPLSRSGVASASAATPVTQGNQAIETLTLSPDSRWLYYDSNRSGRVELYRVPTAGGEPTQLTDAPGGNREPVPSPDGQELAFQSQRNGASDLFVMPAEGGPATPVRVGPGYDNHPSWFPDGLRIGFLHAGGDLPNGYLVAERTRDGWSPPKRVSDYYSGGPAWLTHDGRAVVYDSTASLVLVSLADDTRRTIYAATRPEDPHVQYLGRTLDGQVLFMGSPPGARRALYAVSASGEARPIVRFDDPFLQPLYGGWDADANRLYFTLDDRQSDVWVADARVR